MTGSGSKAAPGQAMEMVRRRALQGRMVRIMIETARPQLVPSGTIAP